MEMKRVFCFSLPVQDYLEKLLLDLKNNKLRAVRLIAGLDEGGATCLINVWLLNRQHQCKAD